MSIVGGVFSETVLKNIQIKADEIWQDRIQKQDQLGDVETIKALKENQTAKITPIEGRKDVDVEISWVNACDVDDRECNACSMPYTELSTNRETYSLDICREAGFRVNDNDLRDNVHDPEELVAEGLLASDRVLCEYLNIQAINWLNANKGVNAVTVGKGVVVGNDTFVPAHLWDAGLLAYFKRCAILNRFLDPYLISGNQLFESRWNSEKDAGNADGKGDLAKFLTFKNYFDLAVIDTVNTPDLVTYMLSKGAFAMANKTYFGPGITKYMDRHVWSVPSKYVPGLSFDVEYMNACDSCYTGNKTALQAHAFKLVMNAGLFLNPLGCTETRTGILTFICGTGENVQ